MTPRSIAPRVSGIARRAGSLMLFTCLTFGATALVSPHDAHAQSAEEVKIARQTAIDGLAAYKEGQFDKAVGLFQQARAIYPSGQILRMLGYSLLGLERWADAAEAMEAALTSEVVPLSEKDQEDVNQQLRKALAHFGTIHVTSKVPKTELIIDKESPRSLPLSGPLRYLEGRHTLVVRAPDHVDLTREVDLGGGQDIDLALDPEPKTKPVAAATKPKETPKPPVEEEEEEEEPSGPDHGWFPGQKYVGIGAMGAGVLLGGAALTASLAGAKIRSNVESDVATHKGFYGDNCSQGDFRLCQYDIEVINNDADRADTLRDMGLFMGIGAGALAATGVVLFIFSGDGGQEDARPGSGKRAAPPVVSNLACGPLSGGVLCSGAF